MRENPMGVSSVRLQQPVLASIAVEPMTVADIPAAVGLWAAQYREARQWCPALPMSWETDTAPIAAFITERVQVGHGLVARTESQVAGFLSYDSFTYHHEEIALCPMIGHAAEASLRPAVYARLYEQAAARWVEEGILLHFVMYFAHDQLIRALLYQLGFGLYVVDAFRSVEPLPAPQQPVKCAIVRAGTEHIDDILRLDAAANDYFRRSPIFLSRPLRHADDDIHRMLAGDTAAYFLAHDGSEAVGILCVRRNDAGYGDLINLVDDHTGVLEFAYLQPAWRHQGVGHELLRHALDWCVERRLHSLHVDYESANLAAAGFWPKEFIPVRYSVRRRVNEDLVK